MTDQRSDPVQNGSPGNHAGTDPNAAPDQREGDARSDIEQAVASRSDAVERGEGGPEPDPMTRSGEYSGVSGDGGEVKNQGLTQQ
jgi:hypothetical protein